jgi:hypothetical protein
VKTYDIVREVDRNVSLFHSSIAQDDSPDNVLDCLYELYESLEGIILDATSEV